MIIEQQLTLLILGIGGGFGLMFALLGLMWKCMQNGFEKLEERMTRLENDMIEVKTVLRLKGC